MNRNHLYLAISFAILSGCYTLEERRLPELRAKAIQPICAQDCTIEIHVTEGDEKSAPPPNEVPKTEGGNNAG
jgi:hypothetical protein